MRLHAGAQSPGHREIYTTSVHAPHALSVHRGVHVAFPDRRALSAITTTHRRAVPPVFTLQLFLYGYCRGIELMHLILAQSGLGSGPPPPPHAPVRPAPYTSVARCTLVNGARASTTRQLVPRYSTSLR